MTTLYKQIAVDTVVSDWTRKQRSIIRMEQVVSVYVMCYNSEKTVTETLESVCRQTYQPLDLVIVMTHRQILRQKSFKIG